MSHLDRIMAYDDLVRRHQLTVLRENSDWAVENGGLKVTRDGDIFVGRDAAHCAMKRLTIGWSYMTPTLQHLTTSLAALRGERPVLGAEMEREHALANPWLPGLESPLSPRDRCERLPASASPAADGVVARSFGDKPAADQLPRGA